jgi:Ferritin-like domain
MIPVRFDHGFAQDGRGHRAGVELEGAAAGRRAFSRQGLAVGVALSGVALLGASPARSVSPDRDIEILNFALLLEHLQAGFYREALDRGNLRGEVRRFAEIVGANEEEHVALLGKALGSRARRRPSFRFDDGLLRGRRFVRSALILEDAGVAAYNGQAANLTREALLPALRIVSVEGRHAAWIRDIAGEHPAPLAADPGLSASAMTTILKRARLLVIR